MNSVVRNLAFIIAALTLSFATQGLSQDSLVSAPDSEPVDTYLDFQVTYPSSDSVKLSGSLFIRVERQKIYLQSAVLVFSAFVNEERMNLGTAVTDSSGTGSLVFPLSGLQSACDINGYITYSSDFEETGRYLPASETVQSKPAWLTVTFSVEDSVKYIIVSGFQKNPEGEVVPVTGESVSLAVPSLFRPLPVGEAYLDDQGIGKLEFPKGLVGDSTGNITIIAQISEHEVFGNVLATGTIDWAYPKHLLAAERPSRELWTPVAPLWMIITLLIMLCGVWGHYIYAIIQLVRIKKLSATDSPADKEE